MPVEIGSLVIKASFGSDPKDSPDGASAEISAKIARTKRELRAEMHEMIQEALRREKER